MSDEHDVLDELGSLLEAVEPSPRFAAGVRARIDDEPTGRATSWWWTAAAVGLSAGIVTVVATHRPAPIGRPPVGLMAARSEATSKPSVRPAEPVRQVASASPSPSGDRVEGPVQRFMLDGHQAVVPDDQRVALIRLLAGVRSGRTTVLMTVVPAYDAEGLLVPLEPLVITPLPDLMSADGDEKPGGGPGSGPGKD